MSYLHIVETCEHIMSESVAELDKDWDMEDLREKATERAHQYADDRCVYYHECLDLIGQLEGEYSLDTEETGKQYAAHEWREAAQFYAVQLVSEALIQGIDDAIGKFEEVYSEVVENTERLGGDESSVFLSHGCPYGWAPHNYETESGVMIWSDEPGHYNPQLLEGELLAVSGQYGHIYINASFQP